MDAIDEGEEFEHTALFREINSPSEKTWKTTLDLLSRGADTQIKNRKNQTYLHALAKACGDCPPEMVDYLVPVVYQLSQARVDINTVDYEGNTALHLCILNNASYRVVAAMLKVGVDPTVMNYNQQEVIHLVDPSNQLLHNLIGSAIPGLRKSISTGDLEKTKFLLDAQFSADPIASDNSIQIDNTLKKLIEEKIPSIRLAHAALAGNADQVKKLFEVKKAKPDPNVRDAMYIQDDGTQTSWPLLAEVIRLKYFEVVKILLEFEADVNVPLFDNTQGSQVPLFQWAFDKIVQTSDKALLKLLLQRADGTLLRDAANFLHNVWKDQAGLFDFLLDRGARLSARNNDGYTVRDLILNDVMRHGISLLRTGLLFIDEYVIKMALESQQLEKLEELALEGYEHINVENKDGKTVKMLARDAKKKKVPTATLR